MPLRPCQPGSFGDKHHDRAAPRRFAHSAFSAASTKQRSTDVSRPTHNTTGYAMVPPQHMPGHTPVATGATCSPRGETARVPRHQDPRPLRTSLRPLAPPPMQIAALQCHRIMARRRLCSRGTGTSTRRKMPTRRASHRQAGFPRATCAPPGPGVRSPAQSSVA